MCGAVLLLMLAADPQAVSAPKAGALPRRYHEIAADLRMLLRRDAVAETKAERAAAIYELTLLYGELRSDPRLHESETLQEYKNRIWSRLVRAKREIEQEIARGRREKPGEKGVAQRSNAAETPPSDAETGSLLESLTLACQLTGGPAALLGQVQGAAGGRAVPDYGPALVDLIERTIAPGFWDSQGGPGTIVYYSPLRVLVVRATSEVHHQVGGVLGGLRAAGR